MRCMALTHDSCGLKKTYNTEHVDMLVRSFLYSALHSRSRMFAMLAILIDKEGSGSQKEVQVLLEYL